MTYVVYEHWRPDTNACFYVGKGKMRRARSFEARNDRYGKIVAKLKRAGLQPEVRIVLIDLDSEGALKAEVERIRQRRAEGVDLANYTDGGEARQDAVIRQLRARRSRRRQQVGRCRRKRSRRWLQRVQVRSGLTTPEPSKVLQLRSRKNFGLRN
jgi:hypothetical protein